MNELHPSLGDNSHRKALRVGPENELSNERYFAYERDDLDEEGLDLRAIIRVLLTYWPWIAGAGALGLLCALAVTLFQTPLYRASATIELNPPSVSVLGAGSDEDVTGYVQSDRNFLETQYGLLKSRALAQRVVENLGLASAGEATEDGASGSQRLERLAQDLSSQLNVSPAANSRLVELTFSSDDPRRAADVVNGFVDAYIRSSIDRKFEATETTRDFLTDQISTTRARLNASERALVDYARANGIIIAGAAGDEEGSGSASLTSSSLSALNSALAAAQQKRIAAEQRFRQAGALSENQAATASLRSEKAALEAEYAEKSTFLGENYPEMVRLRTRIEALNSAIRNASGTASSGLESEYRAALAEENALRARVEQLSGSVLNEQERSVEYKALQREVDTQRSLYQALLERSNEIGVVEGVGAPAGVIVDRATVPSQPYSPSIPRNLVLGLLLGLGFGAAMAFTYETLTDRIKTADDVRDKLRQPLLGSIPKIDKNENIAEEFMSPISPISEAYGTLLTTLSFTTNEGLPRILAITSAGAAEGKSTSSMAIAKRLASTGKRVLLIDADMRRPTFVFESRKDAGLSQMLTGDEVLRDHIVQTQWEGLFVLPGGPIPPNPSILLNSPKFPEVLDDACAFADHVIIDCPPTLGFTDSALIGSVSGGTALVVESGRTRRRSALEAIHQLENARNRLLGVVLTKCPRSANDYEYNYGYYYGQEQITDKSNRHDLTPEEFAGSED